MSLASCQRASAFFPRADATVFRSRYAAPTERPTETSPILDTDNARKPLDVWSVEVAERIYPGQTDFWAPATIPDRPSLQCTANRYLFPVLTRNERLRLTMFFYYTRGALEDHELQSRLQDKVFLAKDTVGWEFVIAGLLDNNTYTRMVTVGLPLAVLPRRESTCAHTVNQPPGAIFTLLKMTDDWRFRESPHVDIGGLRAYAGAPLRFETEFGEHVAFGSLCVASNSVQEPLSKEQQRSLARLADWIVADIINSHRIRRQRERRQMLDRLAQLQKHLDRDDNIEDVVKNLLHEEYPESLVKIVVAQDEILHLGDGTSVPIVDIQNGLWEDSDYFEYMIQHLNHQELVAHRSIRTVALQCASQKIPTYLIVGSKNFQHVFDDIDAWFVQTCATVLCRYWQDRALKEALRAKETFLRGITHQLRTPIHGILGSADLLTEELQSRNIVGATNGSTPCATPDDERLGALDPYTYIKTIRTSARDLISTINSLIKLNQWANVAEAQRLVAIHTIEEIEAALLNELTTFLPEDVTLRPSLIFNHQLPARCDIISLDLRLFLDCIHPILLNAIQNTAGGVVAMTITVTEDYRSMIVDIRDNGCGIQLENQSRIFEAYKKVDNHTTNAGLGLTLAEKLATLMDGHVSLISSEVGKGSHFRATFNDPICASSLSPSRREYVHLPLVFNRLPTGNLTSLINDNFADFLTRRGFTVSQRSSGSLMMLDYTCDLLQLYKTSKRVGDGQVAVCLVPENDLAVKFVGQQLFRDSNVIYMKGPFTSRTIENTLAEADAIFAELEAAKALQLISNEIGMGAFEPTLATVARNESEDDRDPTCPRAPVDEILTKSISNLHINPQHSPAVRVRSTKPMTLLVDDNAINLRFLQMYCKRRSIPYCTAMDGAEAVKLFVEHRARVDSTQKANQIQPNLHTGAPTALPSISSPPVLQPFELVLMDLQMPVCDGIDATRQIRALEKKYAWDKSVIFIVTGQDSREDRASAQEVDSDGYFVKPVGPKVLDTGVGQWFPSTEVV